MSLLRQQGVENPAQVKKAYIEGDGYFEHHKKEIGCPPAMAVGPTGFAECGRVASAGYAFATDLDREPKSFRRKRCPVSSAARCSCSRMPPRQSASPLAVRRSAPRSIDSLSLCSISSPAHYRSGDSNSAATSRFTHARVTLQRNNCGMAADCL
jgi:hypothetical protein